MKNFKLITTFLTLVLALLFTSKNYGQESDEAALAKATQNPLSAMYSLPFQNNTTYGIGDDKKTHNILNIQPVIPMSINKFNIINRIIAPFITQPYSSEGGSKTGFGDISYTTWLSPVKASKIIWGLGPVFQLPTASSNDFGSGKFGIGPSLVALTIIDKWVAGIVVNNVWTLDEDNTENKFLFQYFVNYNLPKAWYIVSAPIMTANWKADEAEKWIVPFGGGVGKVFKVGKLPVNLNAQMYYNLVKPTGWGDWQSRVQLQFLFPKKK